MCICAHSFRTLGTVLGVVSQEPATFCLTRPLSGLKVYLLGELAEQRVPRSLLSRPPLHKPLCRLFPRLLGIQTQVLTLWTKPVFHVVVSLFKLYYRLGGTRRKETSP